MNSNTPQDFGQPYVLENFIAVKPPTTSPSLCAVCHTEVSARRCSGCKNAHYCSAECQSSDRASHKRLCKPFIKTTHTRTSPQHRRGLYLPSNQPQPHFIWLKYSGDGTPLDMHKCFPDVPQDEIKTIAFHNRFLPYWIQISYDGNTVSKRTLDKNAAIGYAFRGPVVALAYDPDAGLSKPALNVDTTILGPLVEYAKLRAEYQGPVFVEQPQERYSEDEWEKIATGAPQGLDVV